MKKFYFTSESVTEGHPDKLCDYISDAILDEALKQDKYSRVAVETFASANQITIAGQLTTNAKLDIEKIVRDRIKEIGYDNAELDIDYRTCKIDINITKQSSDIAQGVDIGGAGDQGIMFGYACNETPEYMPVAICYANKLAKQLKKVSDKSEFLCPDGKTQVTVEYENGKFKRIDTIVVSAQHIKDVKYDQLKQVIKNEVISPVVDQKFIDDKTRYLINPSGSFIKGGSFGDSGTTGRKIVCDTYGGVGRIGGGCLSSKDPTKVDRSAAYYCRYVAKNIVANNLADKCEIQVSYAIGNSEPVSLMIDTFGTGKCSDEKILDIVHSNFDFSVSNIINELDLRKPIYEETSCYGHFGRNEFPWEKIKVLQIG